MTKQFWCEFHQCEHEFYFCMIHDVYYCNLLYHGCPCWHAGIDAGAKVVNYKSETNPNESKNPGQTGRKL